MIRIQNTEYIEGKGEAKFDLLHIKKFIMEFPTNGISKQTIVVELVPYLELESGKRVFNNDKIYKIFISDAEDYLLNQGEPSFSEGYFGVDKAIADVMNQKFPELNVIWEAHTV
jgi:hypothetical protein